MDELFEDEFEELLELEFEELLDELFEEEFDELFEDEFDELFVATCMTASACFTCAVSGVARRASAP